MSLRTARAADRAGFEAVAPFARWKGYPLEMFGAPLREHDERYDHLAEWLQVIRRLWSESDEFDFHGSFFRHRHAELDGPDDRVGHDLGRRARSLRHRVPGMVAGAGVGTVIINFSGPASAQRHDPTLAVDHTPTCTPFPEEPIIARIRKEYMMAVSLPQTG
jgi:hypothetical protein